MARSSLKGQIAEVEHEIKMRRQVYPRLVQTRKMSQGEAELHISRMEDVRATLLWLEKNREAVVSAVVDVPQ